MNYNDVVVLESGRTYTLTRHQSVTLRGGLRITSSDPTTPAILHKAGVASTDKNRFDGCDFFFVRNGTTDLEIDHVKFTGEHTGGWTNGQMSAIQSARAATLTRVSIHHCVFENLVGFAFWALVYGDAFAFQHNTMRNCGNGLNTALSNSTITDNVLYDSEGFEILGHNLYCARNVFHNALSSALSIGGDTGQTLYTSIVVEDNAVYGVTGTVAIITADGMSNAILRRNTVYDAEIGFMSHVSTGFLSESHGILWENNAAFRCTRGYYLPGDGDRITGVVVRGALVRDAVQYGILVAGPHVEIAASDFRANALGADVLLNTASAGSVFHTDGEDANLYDTLIDQR